MDIEKNIRLVMYIVITYFLKWLLLYATITAYLSLSLAVDVSTFCGRIFFLHPL